LLSPLNNNNNNNNISVEMSSTLPVMAASWRKKLIIAAAFVIVSSLCAVTLVVSAWTIPTTTSSLLRSSTTSSTTASSSSSSSSRRMFLDQATKIAAVVPLAVVVIPSSPVFAADERVSGEGTAPTTPAVEELVVVVAAEANIDEPTTPIIRQPRMGHKLQLNASAFTVNDFDCMQLDTKIWPSERVHCELRPPTPTVGVGGDNNNNNNIDQYDFVVEHFDDNYCQISNKQNPIVRHTASGCYNFVKSNHSYNDVCHLPSKNNNHSTFTVSAFYGPGCLEPMPVTAVNLLP